MSASDAAHIFENLFRENNFSLTEYSGNSSPIQLWVNFSEFTRDVLLSSSVNGKKYYCVSFRATRRVRGSTNFSNYRRNVLLSAETRAENEHFFLLPEGIYPYVVRGDEFTHDEQRTKKISLGASARFVKKGSEWK